MCPFIAAITASARLPVEAVAGGACRPPPRGQNLSSIDLRDRPTSSGRPGVAVDVQVPQHSSVVLEGLAEAESRIEARFCHLGSRQRGNSGRVSTRNALTSVTTLHVTRATCMVRRVALHVHHAHGGLALRHRLSMRPAPAGPHVIDETGTRLNSRPHDFGLHRVDGNHDAFAAKRCSPASPLPPARLVGSLFHRDLSGAGVSGFATMSRIAAPSSTSWLA